ncbi:MAG: hypothetical protein ABI551_13660 [Polyangiaceae bacterium]
MYALSLAVLIFLPNACGGTTSTTAGTDGGSSDGSSDGSVDGVDATVDDASDAGVDAAPDATAYDCSSGVGQSAGVSPAFAACAQASDCRLVALGCYCGNQPIMGVAASYESAAASCEATHASSCALGCSTGLDVVAQDGKTAKALADVSVKCTPPPDGGASICQSYVP